MVYRDIEKRRLAARRRYWRAKGVELAEDNGKGESEGSSLPDSRPQTGLEKIPAFHQHQNAVRAENFLRGHWKPIAYSIIGVGSLVILHLFRFRIKEQMDNLKSIASSYTLKPEATPRDSIEALLDYSEDVMRRAAGSV